jgi:peptidoglycan/xylan/chitin deacetylase (PgdA/CDA1 family)
MRKLLLLALLCCCAKALAQDASGHAVILMYHHVSDETPPSTSISVNKFAEHMQYIADNHHVMALPTLIDNLKKGKKLPLKTVAITFDDGYKNIAENGHPILRKHGFPYTIFINPSLIGEHGLQLTWQQVNALQKENVSFANHSSTHKHLLLGSEDDNWLSATLKDIEDAEIALKQKTGSSHKLLAYPYGEFNQQLSSALVKRGYIGFGQHSGAVSRYSDFGALARFPAAGIYANLETLKIKLNSLDMPITAKKINQPQLSYSNRQPSQTITVDLNDIQPQRLGCYFNSESVPITWQQNTFSFSLQAPLPEGRSRVNCTAPSITLQDRFYWYSQPWFVPTAQQQWLD